MYIDQALTDTHYPTRIFFLLPVPYPKFFQTKSGFREVTIHADLVWDYINDASHSEKLI